MRETRGQQLAHHRVQLVEAGAVVQRHVVDLVGGLAAGQRRQQVGLHHVVDKQKSRLVSPSPLMHSGCCGSGPSPTCGITAA
jgi:hypothetical protein